MGLWDEGLGLRAQGVGFRIKGLWFRAYLLAKGGGSPLRLGHSDPKELALRSYRYKAIRTNPEKVGPVGYG